MMEIGPEGFFWWFGVVEDRNDPDKLGRVKIRVFNYHGDKVKTPTNDLQWAPVVVSPNNASFKETGISPNGLLVGSTVFGFFADGNYGQMPIVLGSLHGIPENKVANHDVSNLVRENNTLNKSIVGPEPQSAYSALYPFNKVYRSESGHVIEIDDSPSRERIHFYHKSGTYVEINSEGRQTTKVVNDNIEVVVKDKTVYIQGNCKVEIKGNKEVIIDGNSNLKINGNYNVDVNGEININSKNDVKINGNKINLNRGSKGAARVGDTADTDDSGNNPGSNKIESGSGSVLIGD